MAEQHSRAEVDYDELDAWVGLIQPEFVQVPDGFYTHRIVLDGPIYMAKPMPERADLSNIDPRPIPHHVERLSKPMPRYKRELRWVSTL